MKHMYFKDFVGYPYDREKSEEQARLDDATSVLNKWLITNEEVKVLNVESIYSSEYSIGTNDRKFKKLRVWYTK